MHYTRCDCQKLEPVQTCTKRQRKVCVNSPPRGRRGSHNLALTFSCVSLLYSRLLHTSVIGSWLMAIHVFNDGHSENGKSKFETRERDLNLTLTALQSFLFDQIWLEGGMYVWVLDFFPDVRCGLACSFAHSLLFHNLLIY